MGDRCSIYELQGDLVFGAIERVIRDVIERSETLDVVVLDLTRTSPLDAAARADASSRWRHAEGGGKNLVLATRHEHPSSSRSSPLTPSTAPSSGRSGRCSASTAPVQRPAVTLETHPLTAKLTDAQRTSLAAACKTRRFVPAGEVLVKTGDEAAELYLLLPAR